MANTNIFVNDEGDRIFDDAGHLVLARALGINLFQKSSNGGFIQSTNGARTREKAIDPLTISPKYVCWSGARQSPFGTDITATIANGYSFNPANEVDAPGYSLPNLPLNKATGCGTYDTGPELGQPAVTRSRVGATFEVPSSDDLIDYFGTDSVKFEMVFAHVFPYGPMQNTLALYVSSVDRHSDYATGGRQNLTLRQKANWNWESDLAGLVKLFSAGDGVKFAIDLSTRLGTNVSFVLADYAESLNVNSPAFYVLRFQQSLTTGEPLIPPPNSTQGKLRAGYPYLMITAL